jgi:hypothetical protein
MNAVEEDTTIVGSVGICLRSFDKCLWKTIYLHPREQSLIEDQVGRFSAWTANAGALTPGRASMDHSLREAPEAHSMVVGLLGAFNDRIELCMLHLQFKVTTFILLMSIIRVSCSHVLKHSSIMFP